MHFTVMNLASMWLADAALDGERSLYRSHVIMNSVPVSYPLERLTVVRAETRHIVFLAAVS